MHWSTNPLKNLPVWILEFLVMTEQNILVFKLFLSILVYFLSKNWTLLKKVTSLFPSNPLWKLRSCQAPPPPLPPAERGVRGGVGGIGVHIMIYLYIFTLNVSNITSVSDLSRNEMIAFFFFLSYLFSHKWLQSIETQPTISSKVNLVSNFPWNDLADTSRRKVKIAEKNADFDSIFSQMSACIL